MSEMGVEDEHHTPLVATASSGHHPRSAVPPPLHGPSPGPFAGRPAITAS